MLECMDPNKFGFIPDSSTTFALISILHHWSEATDGTGAHVIVALLDYKKAFELVDHNLLMPRSQTHCCQRGGGLFTKQISTCKAESDCSSDFKPVPAGIPQGTRIGPWLFLVMINNLTSSNALSSKRKFADDTTVSEIVPKFGASVLQDTVHDILRWSNDNRFKLNSLKCKELRIDFRRENNLYTVSLEANGNAFEIVKSAKIIGVTVRNDLK